ncbi:hypothetical protein BSL78_00985 [Apostichopus japonicus]|uniref:Reverse transcriptase domain-containing protein n=1 Tax=Stichopus japonicus TaxID=307972 RepID=A0A2G8LPG0_STIJA|nr:hypothetical protein BSL78_00985 [Apostichopus japonicus]
MGVNGNLLLWIENWLGNRKQRMAVRCCASSLQDVTSGVPQGPGLGHLFFAYINDIDGDILCTTKRIADHTKLDAKVSSKSNSEKFQMYLDKEWKRIFNIDKCKVKHISSTYQGSTFIPANLQASYFLGQCVMCPPGDPGPRGAPGSQGLPGRDGRDAILFSVMASSHYSHKGSGSNFLCLPMHPILSPKSDHHRRSDLETRGWPSPSARPAVINAPIYGTEYNEVLPHSPNILNSEAPCAVCQATGRQSVVVIPGSVECFGEGWTLEYRGYMMSSLYTAYKSEFVCVDDHAEGIHRSGANNDESTIVPVHVKCSASGGGLPCAPYADGQDLPCVVCTQ